MQYCNLSVNINKVALLRNARGGNLPDLYQFAIDCERFGAEGITVHPRPDQRHIRYDDLAILKEIVKTEFNIEGYPSPDFLKRIELVRPHQVTLVPDGPDALTSDEGWEIEKNFDFLSDVIREIKQNGARVSVFVDVNPYQIEWAAKAGTDRVELYTGPYAKAYEKNPGEALMAFKDMNSAIKNTGIGLNAGHDLNLNNLTALKKALPDLVEVSIGHAIIADALYYGIENAIGMYKKVLRKAEI